MRPRECRAASVRPISFKDVTCIFGDSIAAGLGVDRARYCRIVADTLRLRLDDFTGAARPVGESLELLPKSAASPRIAIVAHGITEALVRPTDASLCYMPPRWRRAGWMDARPYYSTRLHFLLSHTGLHTFFDVGFPQPVRQAGLGDSEAPRDLIQRDFVLPGDRDDIPAELGWVGRGHVEHPPSEDESSQVRSPSHQNPQQSLVQPDERAVTYRTPPAQNPEIAGRFAPGLKCAWGETIIDSIPPPGLPPSISTPDHHRRCAAGI